MYKLYKINSAEVSAVASVEHGGSLEVHKGEAQLALGREGHSLLVGLLGGKGQGKGRARCYPHWARSFTSD